jgi:hypothetical protein
MKYIACFLAALVLLPLSAEAGGKLDALMQKNLQQIQKTYKMITRPAVINPKAVLSHRLRLWIHVRNEGQKKLAQQIYADLSKAGYGDKRLAKMPVSMVKAGPDQTQLRLFKKVDAKEAARLLIALKKQLTRIVLLDLSPTYDQMNSIRPGHLELWLSTGLEKLGPLP